MESSLLSPVEALARQFVVPAQPVVVGTSPAKQRQNYHGLIVGDFGLLLASDKVVSEIFETLPQCTLPGSSPGVHAMANQRGNIIPIFDLPLLLGLPREETGRFYYLVIGQNEEAFGVLLERLPEKISLHPDEALENRPPIPRKLAPFVKRTFWQGERIWLEWEPLAFISAVSTTG